MDRRRVAGSVSRFLTRHLPWITVAAVAGYLRLWRIEGFPAYFGDENIYLNLANGFFRGRHTMFAVPYAYVPHPPLFFLLGGIATALFGSTYATLRTLAAVSGIMACLGVYFLGRQLGGRRLALTAGLLLSVMPHAVYYSRLAYGYAPLALLTVLLSLGMAAYLSVRVERLTGRRWVALAVGIIAGLASITEFSGAVLVPFVLVFFFLWYRRDIWIVLCGAVGIPLVSFGYFFLRTPDWFMADLQVNSGRGGVVFLVIALLAAAMGSIPIVRRSLVAVFQQSLVIIPVFLPFVAVLASLMPVTEDLLNSGTTLYWLGLIGLWLLPPSRIRTFVLGETLTLLSYQLMTDRSDRTLLPLFPFFALGMALFLVRAGVIWTQALTKLYIRRSHVNTLCALGLTAIIGFLFLQSVMLIRNESSTDISDSIDHLEELASYITTHSLRSDLVIAEPVMTMLQNERQATVSQLASYGETIRYHHSIGESYTVDRYLFPVTTGEARIVVLDEILLKAVRGDADMPISLRFGDRAESWENELRARKLAPVLVWPSVQIGRYKVFENPDL